jgi:murein DD-endopeptidase MepM/ murein hydrolase activator NlpD
MLVIISVLMVFDFFGGNISSSGYIENNIEYADDYISALNNNITIENKGYVPLGRILYFFYENEDLSFDEIYNLNLDTELKIVKPISDVCNNNFKGYFVCKESEINSGNQDDEYTYKPFNAPIDFSNVSITSFFGQERVVYDEFDVHYAWDFAGSPETPIYSVGEGFVKEVRFNQDTNEIKKDNGAGNYIVIEYEVNDEKVDVLYGHLYPNSSKVKVGDLVEPWQIIASMGTTGYSTGNHLHFEVTYDGNPIDGMSLVDFLNTNEDIKKISNN